MKKLFILSILLLMGCFIASAEDLKHNGTIVRHLRLEVPEQIVKNNKDASISWDLSGDWDKFDYSFSQGSVSKKVFSIKLSKYQGGADGITLTIKPKSKLAKGQYNLKMKVHPTSNIEFNKMNLNLNVNYAGVPPQPWWVILMKISIPLCVLVLIIVLMLHFTAIFPKGMLQLGDNVVYLKGKKQISIRKELETLGISLDSDVDVILAKKRFGTFQGPCIVTMKNCFLECDEEILTSGKVILPGQEIHGLKDINGEDITMIYC